MATTPNQKANTDKDEMIFDNIELISIESQSASFPKHFHETFCFSLIYEGVNQIDFEHQVIYSKAGCMSIVNPYEIHSNPLINGRSTIKFDTIYIPDEVVKFILKGKNIRFIVKTIANTEANQSFLSLKAALITKKDEIIELSLIEFFKTLQSYWQENKEEYSGLNFDQFNQISDYIERNIHDKFYLDELARSCNINKFGFSKKFKQTTGMTPMNYILMRKIFSSKQLIDSQSELTEIAYKYNFTDLAHYSKTFKRYIGVTPLDYKKSQDYTSEPH